MSMNDHDIDLSKTMILGFLEQAHDECLEQALRCIERAKTLPPSSHEHYVLTKVAPYVWEGRAKVIEWIIRDLRNSEG